MATTYVATSPKPSLLTLPGEIRNEIYRLLLTTRYNLPCYDKPTAQSLHPAILRVNRQINKEATNVLHGDNFWIIAQVNIHQWSEAIAVLPFVTKKDPSHIRYPALHVTLDPLLETTATESTTMIMGVESLPFFIHKLRMSGRSAIGGLMTVGLTLRLYTSPFHSQPKLQSKCLEPFTLVRGFGKYTVRGDPDPIWSWHREDMMSRATSPFKDAGAIRGIAMGYLAQGDDAYSLGNFITAYAFYEIGRVFLEHASKSLLAYIRTQAQYSHSQQAREKFEIDKAQGVLRAHTLRPLVAIHRHRAVISACKSSKLDPRFLTEVEQVGVIFCKALSCASLGERKEEKALIVRACNLEVTKHDFVQVILDVCPEPLHKKYMARILKSKNMYDMRRCKRKRKGKSNGA